MTRTRFRFVAGIFAASFATGCLALGTGGLQTIPFSTRLYHRGPDAQRVLMSERFGL